jgi:transposase InsO family protein
MNTALNGLRSRPSGATCACIRETSAKSLRTEDQSLELPSNRQHDRPYPAQLFRNALKIHSVTPSMSRKANCYDNAAMESFVATLKTERFQDKIPKNLAEAARSSSIISKLSTTKTYALGAQLPFVD